MFNWFKTSLLMAAIVDLFRTHPPTEERIARLRAMI
jgi:Zn-dependent protease with chaperone function